jgi:hypothetical protein
LAPLLAPPPARRPFCGLRRNVQDNATLKALARRNGEMSAIIYLVGLVVIIMFILSFLGLR